MRRLLLTVLSLAALTSVLANTARADLKPGLLGEYFVAKNIKADLVLSGTKPFFVRIDKQVNFAEASGDFYGSKLADGFFVRWTGVIRITKPGEYTFATTSDDGSRLYIDGKRVVENWGPHSMTRKEGKATLTAGDHPFRITYQEGGGGAGCIATWKTPGGKEEPIPASALFHNEAQAKTASAAWDKKKWDKTKAPNKGSIKRKAGVNYTRNMGPTIGTAVLIGNSSKKENIAFRGIIIPLNDDATTGVLFDTDTMRMAAGWTSGGPTLNGLPFTGGHGAFPSLGDDTLFTNRAAPGWANAKGELNDPRDGDIPKLGPLPKDWAQYQGMYMHGDRVVLKYKVGDTDVLETPTLVTGASPIIVRTFQVGSRDFVMTIALADAAEYKVTINGHSAIIHRGKDQLLVGSNTLPSGAKFEVVNETVVLRLPAANGKTQFDLILADAAAANNPAITVPKVPAVLSGVNFDKLTKPGPQRFPKTFTTEAQLASDKDEAKNAYVVDRLTVPYGNAYEPRMRIGGMDFFSDGKRAAVSTWDGDVWIVSGIKPGKALGELTWKRFATGLHEPLGLKIVDDVIYTVDDARITRFHDLNNDGEADFYENFNSDWELTSGFHAFCFDLHTDKAGNFYFAFGSPVRGGGSSFERMSEHHGSIIRVSKDGKKLQRYATGLRAPNGIGVGPDGQVTSGDNEGTFVPRCPIHWISKGEFLGVVDSASADLRNKLNTTATVKERVPQGKKRTLDASEMPKPLAWLPKNIDNSGGGQAWVTSDKWGPFNGSLLHMSYGQSSLYLVLPERKAADSGAIRIKGATGDDPLMQGGVVKFPLRFTSSAMRARFNPLDGQLYVAGLKGWQSNAGKEGGLDRVRYTGNTVLMPTALKTTKTGLEITFSQKLDAELANDPDSFSVRGTDIRWSHGYGTREYKLGQRNSSSSDQGWTQLKVKSSKLLADGKTVAIEVENMQPAHEMEINIDLETVDGDVIRTKINNTVHVVE